MGAAGAVAPAAVALDPGPGGLPPGTAPPHRAPHPGAPPHGDPPRGNPPHDPRPHDDAPPTAPDHEPRPVAPRPTAGVPGAAPSGADLAVRDLRVRATVPLAAARAAGVSASFVPRPGSLVAVVSVYSRGGRRLLARRVVPARGGRRVTVRLRSAGLRRGVYEIAVRAGAGRATLGPAVSARVRIT
jgi:hypothetical protein